MYVTKGASTVRKEEAPRTPIDTTAWAADFEAFHARFAGYFARREPREQMVKYVHGLLSSVQRKNGWQIAEAVGASDPQPPQRLL